jgi:hypothetical protein
MSDNESHLDRRAVVTGVGLAAAGLAATAANAQRTGGSATSDFSPERHENDAWFDALSGSHRIFIDSSTPDGGASAMLYANNLYVQQESAYGGSATDLALVICFRRGSTAFGFSDAIWSKYGEIFGSVMQITDTETQAAPRMNPVAVAGRSGLSNRNVTLGALRANGAQFAICSVATRNMARRVADATGGNADAVLDELVAGAIENGRFVPAGVVAATRAQEYRYSLLYAG